jgi:hypothetical protein
MTKRRVPLRTKKMFNDVLRAAARYRTLEEALAANPHLPSSGMVYLYTRHRPDQHRRLLDAIERGRCLHNPCSHHFANIKRWIAKGLNLRAALRANPSFPSETSFRHFLKKNPTYLHQIQSVSSSFQTQEFSTVRQHYDKILELVAGGMSIAAAVETNPDFPSRYQVRNYAESTPELLARFEEAKRLGAPKFKSKAFTDEQYDRSLAIIMANPGVPTRKIDCGDGPNYRVVIWRTQRDPAFKEKYRSAIGERGRRLRATKSVVNKDVVLARVMALVPMHLDRDARYDIISNIVVDVLAGTIAPGKIEMKVPAYVSQWQSENSVYEFRSLDAELSEDGDFTLLDTLSTSEWTFEAA